MNLYLARRTKTPRKASLVFFSLFLLLSQTATAQRVLNLEHHDQKPYYFGITLAGGSMRFQADLHPRFLQQDSILVAEPRKSAGFSLGLLATTRLSPRFETR